MIDEKKLKERLKNCLKPILEYCVAGYDYEIRKKMDSIVDSLFNILSEVEKQGYERGVEKEKLQFSCPKIVNDITAWGKKTTNDINDFVKNICDTLEKK